MEASNPAFGPPNGQAGSDRRAVDEQATALGLPSPDRVTDKMVELCREYQPLPIDDLLDRVIRALGLVGPDQGTREELEQIFDEAVADELLGVTSDDEVVEPLSLCAGTFLTHRLTSDEHAGGFVNPVPDFPLTALHNEVRSPGAGSWKVTWQGNGMPVWEPPAGWLEHLAPGMVIVARLDEEAIEVTAATEDLEPPAPAVVGALIEVYQKSETQEEGSLPVFVDDLYLDILVKAPTIFRQPQAPLSEVLACAGLEVRGKEVAHHQRMWANGARARQIIRVVQALGDEDVVDDAMMVLRLFNEDEWQSVAPLRQACQVMAEDPSVAEVVANEMLGWATDNITGLPSEVAKTARFAARLLAVARRPPEMAVARWLSAVAAEAAGDLAAAESHLRTAVSAGPGWPLPADRLAWYISDQGDADEALRLWRSAGLNGEDPEVRALERYGKFAKGRVGRNEPCWCGSERKYKQCHLGQAALAPLPERLPWLLNKAMNYMSHNQPRVAADVARVVSARWGDDFKIEDGKEIFSDPLIMDLVFTECGWWERFVAERGPLLPDDEALLATSWLLVQRTVYEVLSVEAGEGLAIRDLRTGDEVNVKEQAFSKVATPGLRFCARAVPDGRDHQLVGAVMPVPAGREADLLDLLDKAEPEAIAEWAAALVAPPTMATREREAMVVCKTVLLLPHRARAVQVLDDLYERSEDGQQVWHELFDLNDEERIVRAVLWLDADRLTVETMSQERTERVLKTIKTKVPGAKVVEDERRPFDPSRGPVVPPFSTGAGLGGLAGAAPGGNPGDPGPGPLPVMPPELVEQVQERMERRWCDEHVPALKGLTPRQAAGDPAGRESLERLLAEFERSDRQRSAVPSVFVGMRPARLRQMLGLVEAGPSAG